MANQPWYKEKNRLADENKRLRTIASQLMIAGGNPGGIPNAPYDAPKEDPRNPYVPAPKRDKLAGLRINPNTILLPKEPAPAETDEDYGEGDVKGHPDWKMAHGKHFDEYGRIIQDPGFGIDRGGNPIRLPHMEQTPEEAEKNRQLHINKYHQASATSRQIRDRLKPFTKGKGYDSTGGSLRGIPDSLRIQLLRDAKA